MLSAELSALSSQRWALSAGLTQRWALSAGLSQCWDVSAELSQRCALSAGLSALFSHMCTCVSHTPTISLAACGCRQLRECDGSGGGVPIVSYLVDECPDFIGEGGEGGGGNVLFLQCAIYRGKVG